MAHNGQNQAKKAKQYFYQINLLISEKIIAYKIDLYFKLKNLPKRVPRPQHNDIQPNVTQHNDK